MVKSFIITKQIDVEIPDGSPILKSKINSVSEQIAICQDKKNFADLLPLVKGVDFYVQDNGIQIEEKEE